MVGTCSQLQIQLQNSERLIQEIRRYKAVKSLQGAGEHVKKLVGRYKAVKSLQDAGEHVKRLVGIPEKLMEST